MREKLLVVNVLSDVIRMRSDCILPFDDES